LAFAAALLGGAALLAPAASASQAAGLYVVGAGNGHGVGMSQYGAAGYALHGAGYQQILRDYYSQTTLGHVSPGRIVTVLLRAQGAAMFSGATRIKGSPLKLDPSVAYQVLRAAGGRLRVAAGRHRIGVVAAPLQVSGPGPVKLIGLGEYRGALSFRPSANGNGVTTINAVGLDDYVRGVVAAEMPPGWPAQALEAQAVAARTYAIASRPVTASFEVYDNTNSQMYGGVKAETASGDAAVAATSGQVVEYNDAPIVTYFFSSSGGETESIQNVFSLAPEPWLVGRPDPYDDTLNNPYHHWKLTLSLNAAKAKLGGLVQGSLKGIKVLQHGVSPRIVKARVVGTKGSVDVTGDQLRRALGTPSTWMTFTTISSHGGRTTTNPSSPTTTTTTTSTTPSGGTPLIRRVQRAAAVLAGALSAVRLPTNRYAVTGTVFPVTPHAHVRIQFDPGDGWVSVASGVVAGNGSYSVAVADPGTYRVLYAGIAGPAVSVG
ncbi:MAG: SpoIID/LytB domain-containing protein, partial [Acidobacteriota bacterium]|nr:SpoIID/LytB domain-containing protein [Acidobacteriota bacterium]